VTEERKIRYSNGCIKEIDMPPLLKKYPKKKRLVRVVSSDILGDLERVFVPFEIETYDKETDKTITHPMLVDTVTGSMYDRMTGRCLSSTRLKLGD
jgi:hypothetical protein